MTSEQLKGMTPATFFGLNVALAALIIVALVRIPPSAAVSNFQFFLICAGTFTAFGTVSVLAKLRIGKALLWAGVCSLVTLFAAAATAALIHGVGPCL